jgi:hypothetical protein
MASRDSFLRSKPSLRTVARSAAGLAGLTGGYGVLALLGAFGSVACVGESVSGEGTGAEGASGANAISIVGEATDGCVSGTGHLLSGGEVAPEFFAWPAVLLAVVTLGVAAAWTGHKRATWLVALAAVAVSVAGFLSIGRHFVLPALFLLVAAVALTVESRRGIEGPGRTEV